MKDKKEKKIKKTRGFTLIELLVAIVILGIITVMALPAINAFKDQNRLKKYETYERSMISAAKLYTDSYNEDLFGYDKEGCATITYDQLKEKNLLKDIKIDNVSCAGANTYVVVTKKNNKYTYKTKIVCIQDGDPSKEVYSHGNATCTASATNTGPTITVAKPNLDSYAADKTFKITIHDDDGLYATDIRYKWVRNDQNADNVAWIDSYVPITNSDKKDAELTLKTPEATGNNTYKLLIESRNIKDIYNNTVTYQETMTVRVYKNCTDKKDSGSAWNVTNCNKSCGGGTLTKRINQVDKYNTSVACGTRDYSAACNTNPCYGINNCNIRGTRIYSQSYSWTCSSGHSHTTGYKHYCSDGSGNLQTKDSNPNLVTYRWVCPWAPYGTADGWTIIND